jgi:glutamate--cysteine ligase
MAGDVAETRRGPLRVGLEVEVIPVSASTGRRVPPWSPAEPSTVTLLDALAAHHAWSRCVAPSGAPAYRTSTGGRWSFEPGGQLEYSSPPFTSVDALLQDVECNVATVSREASARGIRLLARGVDPFNAPQHAPLVLEGERYRRMAAHFGRLGPAGHCMMCQTAAVHVNVDPVAPTPSSWRVANAMAPVLLATFANSRRYAGAETGARSWRAEQWRRLDPRRTGVFGPCAEPGEAYLDFALDAPAFLLGDAEDARPFREWLPAGVGVEAFERHLSTLFPEARPRGYLELRSFDALPLRFLPAACVLVVGVLQDPRSLAHALELLPTPTGDHLSIAGGSGLSDPGLGTLAGELATLGLEGAARLGPEVVGVPSLESAEAFFQELTRQGRDPGDVPGDDVL